MGLLVSCCLRLMGYDNLGGVAAAQASQRHHQLNVILAERDNPNINGRNQETVPRYETFDYYTDYRPGLYVYRDKPITINALCRFSLSGAPIAL